MSYTTNQNVGKVRIQAIFLIRQGKTTREVARHLGYAQSTIVKWWKRRNETWHQKSLPTRSSRPHVSPRAVPPQVVAAIVSVRMRTKRCSEVVHRHLKNEGVYVSLSTVKRVLSRYGLLKKRSPWKKIRRYPLRPNVAKQGDLVQMDTIHFVDKHGKRSYVYTALDVYSRYGFAWISDKANTYASITFLEKTLQYFPFSLQCIQTDNGPEFGRYFTDATNRMHISHRHSRVRKPNDNAHLERFNRSIQEEMPRHLLSIWVAEDIALYVKHYNQERLHMGIQFKTPEQMLQK